MTQSTKPQPIPLPPDFPVVWERPEDAQGFWERETSHVPGQATMLDDSFARRWIDEGFNAACEDFSMPVRNAYRRVNTYVYQSIAPVSHDHAQLEQLGRTAQERLGAAIGRQRAVWDGEHLPEIKDLLGRWRAFDLEGASDAELVGHLHDSIAWSERAWHIHFLVAFPLLVSMSLFDDFYADLLGGDGDGFGAFRLLQGQDNLSLVADRALYALSRLALASDSVRNVLETVAADEVVDELAELDDAQEFLGALGAFLAEHGRRASLYLSVSAPSWIEDPTPLITVLQDATTQPERDPLAKLAELADECDRLTADARAQLESFPAAVREQFEFLLDAARQGSVLQEDHNYWIDTQIVYSVRQVVLELGRRLVANGAVDAEDDVFHLRLEELDDLSADLRSVVAERRLELERFSGIASPAVLGMLPPGPPPDDPISRAVIKMFGGQPRESESADVLYGMAGSPGVARGRVRIVRSLAEGDSLEFGEILVAPTTAPPWTPLFARAAAIVTDAGGILSHCAVVAREYSIPAVVGAKRATASLRDGQLVEVDGTNGRIHVVDE
jgi:phosphohistidine swiveling domain-containing protein